MRLKANEVGLGVSAFFALFSYIIFSCGPTFGAYAQRSPNEYAVGSELSDNSIHQTWQIGGFVGGGFPPYYSVHAPLLHYHEELLFYSAGLEVGRTVTATHGPNFLRGRGEAVVDVSPYWEENHPAQTVVAHSPGNSPGFSAHVGAYSIHGSSITPFQFRWNFLKKDTSRFVPWVQPGFGLLWTNQDFPQGYGDAAVAPIVRTSHMNFTPQVDFGENIFVHRNQSLSLGVQAIHITNFALSAYDPGVNVIVEFRAGYSWWR